jgi:hypothetical protein
VAARPTSAEAPTAGDSRAPHAPDHGTFESSRQAFIERRRSKQALPAAIDHRPFFRCSNISRKQQSRALSFTLSNVSIEIRAGEITGLVGLNGSGKSTLLKIIAGVLAVDDGEISYPALAEGFLQGRLDMPYEADSRWKEVANVYDQKARAPQGLEWEMWDASYYNGRFYLYFSPLPVLLFYIPLRLVTGSYPPDAFVAAMACAWAFLTCVAFARGVLRDRKLLVPFEVWVLLIGLANVVPFTLTHVRM